MISLGRDSGPPAVKVVVEPDRDLLQEVTTTFDGASFLISPSGEMRCQLEGFKSERLSFCVEVEGDTTGTFNLAVIARVASWPTEAVRLRDALLSVSTISGERIEPTIRPEDGAALFSRLQPDVTYRFCFGAGASVLSTS